MDFDPVWGGCFEMTNAEVYAAAAPYVAVYALMLGIGIVGMVARRKPRVLLDVSGRRGR